MEKRPFLGACALGLLLGLAGTACALLIAAILLHVLPPELWGNSAAAGIAGLSPGKVFFAAVVFAPVVETFVGQVLPIEAAHRLGADRVICVLLSGLVFGAAHLFNGGLAHGITTFFSGAIFATGYVTARWSGVLPAFVAAGTAHAVQNMTVLFVIAPYFPGE